MRIQVQFLMLEAWSPLLLSGVSELTLWLLPRDQLYFDFVSKAVALIYADPELPPAFIFSASPELCFSLGYVLAYRYSAGGSFHDRLSRYVAPTRWLTKSVGQQVENMRKFSSARWASTFGISCLEFILNIGGLSTSSLEKLFSVSAKGSQNNWY